MMVLRSERKMTASACLATRPEHVGLAPPDPGFVNRGLMVARLHAMLRTFLDATVRDIPKDSSSVPQRSLEAQADYVGSYIMAMAGYDLQTIGQVWHRLERVEVQQAALLI